MSSHSLCRDGHVNTRYDVSVSSHILCVGMTTLTSYKTDVSVSSLCRDGHVNIIQEMMSSVSSVSEWFNMAAFPLCAISGDHTTNYKVTEFVFLCHIRHQSYKMPVLAYLHHIQHYKREHRSICLSVAYSASCQVAVWVCLHHIQHHTRWQCLYLCISDVTFNVIHCGNVCLFAPRSTSHTVQCLSLCAIFNITHGGSCVCLSAPHSASHTVAVFVSLRRTKSMSHKTVVGASLSESLSTKTL